MFLVLLYSFAALSGSWTGYIDATGAGGFDFSNPYGDVTIKGVEGNMINVQATISGRQNMKPADLMEKMGIELTKKGDKIELEITGTQNLKIDNPPQIDFVITLPATLPCDISVVNGDLQMRDLKAAGDYEAVNGNIDAIVSIPQGEYESVNGEIQITATESLQKDSLKIETVNGDITLTLKTGSNLKSDIETVNGSVKLPKEWKNGMAGDGKAKLSIESVNGSIEVIEVGSAK